MQQLYVVRHGESELNALHIFAGQIDTPLTGTGREQARAAGRQATEIPIDRIISSPLKRALETAQLIANGIDYPADNIIANMLFVERSLGSLEGKSWEDVEEDHIQGVDIESWDALLERAREGLEFLQALTDDVVLLASHGTFIRALQTVLDSTRAYPEPTNAQIVQLI
jgi:broad specificity phosphatase PhoE